MLYNNYDDNEDIPDFMIEQLMLSFEDKYRAHKGCLKWAEYWCQRYLENELEALELMDAMGIYREEVLGWVIEFGYKLQTSHQARAELLKLLQEQREQNIVESFGN